MKFNTVTALRGTLAAMETPQLDALLLEELRKDVPSAQRIRLISSILKERDRELAPQIDDNARRAWEAYLEKSARVKPKPGRMKPILVKAASLILVLLTLMALLPQKAEASNFFQRIIAWTEDVFSFASSREETAPQEAYVFRTDNPGFQEVYDQVVELGITDPVVPMWLPEGYELVGCEVINNPTKTYLTATFSNGQKDAVYQLDIYSDNITTRYYKDGTIIQEEEKHGITHTILRNNDLLVAVWTIDNIECSIFIDCPEDTLIRILESIYTMEDN